MKDRTDPTNRDTVPAMLTPGEFVINKEATQMYGDQLKTMNNNGLAVRAQRNSMAVPQARGSIPQFNEGGEAKGNWWTDMVGSADHYKEKDKAQKAKWKESQETGVPMYSGREMMSMLPVVGDAIAAEEVYNEIRKPNPNWLLVGALGGATIVGAIPGIGDAAAALIKKGAKAGLSGIKTIPRIRLDVPDPATLGSLGGNIKIKKAPSKNPMEWDPKTKADYLQDYRLQTQKEMLNHYGPNGMVMQFHSTPYKGRLDVDNFRYRGTNSNKTLQSKLNNAAVRDQDGIYTHGYDQDGSRFGDNIYAVESDSRRMGGLSGFTQAMDTDSGYMETFIPRGAVDDIRQVWPISQDKADKFLKTYKYNTGGLVTFLKDKEGYGAIGTTGADKNKAYKDSGGVWTIGYGRTFNDDGSKVKEGDTSTSKKENAWLSTRAEEEYDAVKKFSDDEGYGWNQDQLESFASFRYNNGPKGFEQLAHKNTGNPGFADVPKDPGYDIRYNRSTKEMVDKMPLYKNVNGKEVAGLVARRAAEVDLAGPVPYDKRYQGWQMPAPQEPSGFTRMLQTIGKGEAMKGKKIPGYNEGGMPMEDDDIMNFIKNYKGKLGDVNPEDVGNIVTDEDLLRNSSDYIAGPNNNEEAFMMQYGNPKTSIPYGPSLHMTDSAQLRGGMVRPDMMPPGYVPKPPSPFLDESSSLQRTKDKNGMVRYGTPEARYAAMREATPMGAVGPPPGAAYIPDDYMYSRPEGGADKIAWENLQAGIANPETNAIGMGPDGTMAGKIEREDRRKYLDSMQALEETNRRQAIPKFSPSTEARAMASLEQTYTPYGQSRDQANFKMNEELEQLMLQLQTTPIQSPAYQSMMGRKAFLEEQLGRSEGNTGVEAPQPYTLGTDVLEIKAAENGVKNEIAKAEAMYEKAVVENDTETMERADGLSKRAKLRLADIEARKEEVNRRNKLATDSAQNKRKAQATLKMLDIQRQVELTKNEDHKERLKEELKKLDKVIVDNGGQSQISSIVSSSEKKDDDTTVDPVKKEKIDAIVKSFEQKNGGRLPSNLEDAAASGKLEAAGNKKYKPGSTQWESAKGFLKNIFGDLFNKKDLVRAISIYLGARLFGASGNQAGAMAGKYYLGKQDQHEANVAAYAKSGKYEPTSVAAFEKSRNVNDLIHIGKPAVPTGVDKTLYGTSSTGKPLKIQVAEFNLGPNHNVWKRKTRLKDGSIGWVTVDTTQWSADGSRVQGTPEYNAKVKLYYDKAKDLTKEQLTYKDPDDDNKEKNAIPGLKPNTAADQLARWAVDNDIDLGSASYALGLAINMAKQQADKDGKVEDLTPHLNQAFIVAEVDGTGQSPVAFKNLDGEYIPYGDLKNALVNVASIASKNNPDIADMNPVLRQTAIIQFAGELYQDYAKTQASTGATDIFVDAANNNKTTPLYEFMRAYK